MTMLRMKATIVAVLALSAISVAVTVTATAYSDAACATLAASPVLGLGFLFSLDVCSLHDAFAFRTSISHTPTQNCSSNG